MKRREFITLAGGAAASVPLVARAQRTSTVRKVGILLSGVESDPDSRVRIEAFRKGFADLGWRDGDNVISNIAGRPAKANSSGNMPRNWWRSRPT